MMEVCKIVTIFQLSLTPHWLATCATKECLYKAPLNQIPAALKFALAICFVVDPIYKAEQLHFHAGDEFVRGKMLLKRLTQDE